MERFLDYFVPTKYSLNLGINKTDKKIGGAVAIIGEAKAEAIKFHAVDLSVSQVMVNGQKTKFALKDNVLTLSDVPTGDLEVLIVYDGSLNENMEGAYLSTYEYEGNTEVIVATQFESHYAREAFPCIDEPAAKAVFEVKLTVPEVGDLVLMNTPVANTKKYSKVPDGKYTVFYNDDGKKVASKYTEYTFEPTPRMSTYLLAWVIGKFQGKTITNAHGTEITTYCSLAQDLDFVDFANEIAAKSLEFYDDNFDEPYPLPKCVQVALPDFEAGAMENWGLVTYRESMLLAGKNATLSTKKCVALTVAHELSHQWFGDLVTMAWWDDLWLNESFASVMEYYAVDHCYPEFKIWEGFYTGDCLAALKRDCLTGVQSVHQDVANPEEIATLFDPAIVYAKGARLMLMLIRLMGWTKFCQGVSEYFNQYKYSNTVGDDLWACLNPHADFDVAEFMHSFIDQPGYPVVVGQNDFSEITQHRFLLDAEMPESDWPLPAIREDMSGHYILNLSEAEFQSRLNRFDQLDLEAKLRLLIDRSLLAKTSLVPSASLIPLLAKFQTERSAAVWSIILNIIAQLKIFFDYGSAEETKFKNFVKELVQPALAEVGLVARKSDDENTLRLRAILLGLDFYAEDLPNIKQLAAEWQADYAKLNPESRADILDAKLYVDPKQISKYLQDYQQIADPELKFELLFAGTVSKNSNVLSQMVKLLDQSYVVKPQDQFSLFIYLFRNMEVQDQVFDWLSQHWDYVKNMAGDKSLENYPRYTASTIRTPAMFQKWQDFFDPLSSDPALARAIEMGRTEIKSHLDLITADRPAVHQALE